MATSAADQRSLVRRTGRCQTGPLSLWTEALEMANHQILERRSLAMVERIVARIDQRPELLEGVRETCARWLEQRDAPAHREWWEILKRPWVEVRELLLDSGPEGQRLRQSDPFVGLLSNHERWAILRETR